MSFNFGQTADFGTIGSGELSTGAGESALFSPGELGPELFSPQEEEIVEGDPIVPQSAPAKTQTKPNKGKNLSTSAKPAEKEVPLEPLKSILDTEEEVEEVPAKNLETLEELGEGEENNNEDQGNPYEDYAKDMFEAGIFTPLPGDEDLDFTDETVLQNRFQKEKEVGANQIIDKFLSRFGPKQKAAFDAIFVKGNDPETYYQASTRIENLEGLDLADAGTQEKLARSYMGKLGWSEEDISDRIEKLKTYDDLEKEAKIAHKHLLKYEKDQLAADALANQQKLQREIQIENMYIGGVQQTLQDAIAKKDLGGIPVNRDNASRIFDIMSNKRWELNGRKVTTFEKVLEDLKDPRNVEQALKVALLFDNKFDFTPIEKKAVSKETHKLFNSIKRKQTTQGRSRPDKSTGESWQF